MRLLIFGFGYCGAALARAAAQHGFAVTVASRSVSVRHEIGVSFCRFDAAYEAISRATHIVVTAPPGADGDPVLALYRAQIAGSDVTHICYYSTTGTYGDRGGAEVHEDTLPNPQTPRAQLRLAAEDAWRETASGICLDLCRIAGIYGPGRSAFDALRTRTARRIEQQGHLFGRIHRDDITGLTLAALRHPPGTVAPDARILHFTDSWPAAPADVTAYAANLLRIAPPAAQTLAEAWPSMSEMARSFWSESRIVVNAATLAALHCHLLYPSYREGLEAILRIEGEVAHTGA